MKRTPLLRRSAARVARQRVVASFEAIESRRLMSVTSPTFGNNGNVHIGLDGDGADVSYTAANAAGQIVTVTDTYDAPANTYLVSRFTADGKPDVTFDGDGSMWVSGAPENVGGTLGDVAMTADGSVFIATIETSYVDDHSEYVGLLTKVSPSGASASVTEVARSQSADTMHLATSANGGVYATFTDPDAYPSGFGGSITRVIAATNSVDATYGAGGIARFALPDGTRDIDALIVDAAGRSTLTNTSQTFERVDDRTNITSTLHVGTVGATGTTASWSTPTTLPTQFVGTSIAARAGGTFAVVGTTYGRTLDGSDDFHAEFVGLKADLTLDATFGTDGFTTADGQVANAGHAISVDGAGNVYSAGTTGYTTAEGNNKSSATITKLLPSGKLDPTFGNDGQFAFAPPSTGPDFAYSVDLDTTGDGGVVLTALGAVDPDGFTLEPDLYKIAGPVVVVPPTPPTPAPVVPYTITDGVLTYNGTSGNDVVTLGKSAAGTLVLTINGVPYPITTTITGVAINGGAGNDLIKVSNAITIPATLTGGAGNDTLRGGGGNDVLLGGDGDDALIGRDGQDFLLGGTGRDLLIGNTAADILLSGTTSLDQAGIDNVMKEWTSNHAYLLKLANLTGYVPQAGRLNGNSYLKPEVTVFNDTAVDTLSGGDGADFYYAQLFGSSADVIQDNMTAYRSDIAALVVGD